MLSKGLFESLPEFLWRIVMKLPEFNLFSDKSVRIFFIFPSICPNFHGFPKFGGGQPPPLAPPCQVRLWAFSQGIKTDSQIIPCGKTGNQFSHTHNSASVRDEKKVSKHTVCNK